LLQLLSSTSSLPPNIQLKTTKPASLHDTVR
jgi:hypothetical protein